MVYYRKIWHTYHWCIYTGHILRWRAVSLTKHKWFCNETKERAPIISIKWQPNRYIKMFMFSHISITSFSLRVSDWIHTPQKVWLCFIYRYSSVRNRSLLALITSMGSLSLLFGVKIVHLVDKSDLFKIGNLVYGGREIVTSLYRSLEEQR